MQKFVPIFIASLLTTLFARAQADLKIIGDVNVVAPNPLHVGITVNITFNVQNIGDAVVGASHTRIYFSPTQNSSQGQLLSVISLEPLSAGALSNNIQFNFPIPYNVVIDNGTYYIIIKLNDDGAIAESDYSNNSKNVAINNIDPAPWAAQNIPYPIIFVHGYMSDNTTWNTMITYLQNQYGWSYGGNMDFCLNADQNLATSNITTDYHDFTGETGHILNSNPCDFYTINFAVNPDGSANYDNQWESNQAAIVKQGKAIQDAINHVLAVTHKDKVILVCHSMGGLAAREYLQNQNLYQISDSKKHIAKLVTIGTPHGGTNIPALYLGGIWNGFDEQSEAIRDLRTTYATFDKQGVYLFGGLEDQIYMSDYGGIGFHNVNVNCNEIPDGETIIGINDNNKTISTDLTYSCIIGTGDPLSVGGDGDGVVTTKSANINNFLPVNAPVFTLPKIGTLNVWHTELTKQFAGIMQGIDEPSNDFDTGHAYSISSGRLYYGNITYQSITSPPRDYDSYIINTASNSTLNIQVYNIPTPVYSINIFTSSNTPVYSIDNHGKSYLNVDVPVTPGNYYIVLSGVPDADSYKYPYAFKCTFAASTSSCSGTTVLTNTSGSFSDGSGSSNYSNNADCRWLIQPSGATKITLRFSSLKVSNPGDTLFVYDGGTTTSPLLKKLTGNSLPANITSTGGTMLVRFSTNATTAAAGWDASYTAATVPVFCSGITKLIYASGALSDGSGSANYGNYSHCSWLITPEGGYSATLNFTAFNTEAGKDVVNVYDGFDNTASLLGSFSGNSVPAALTSSGGGMFIEFITNDTITAAGWTAYYTSYIPYSTTGITEYETWFDDNYSSKTSVSVSQQDTFRLNSVITTASLQPGLHTFHIRFKDTKNRWASTLNQFFIKPPITSGINAITGYEYWFDSNYAAKIMKSISREEIYQLLTGINTNGLTPGLHSFHIRFKDAGNVWGSTIDQFIINAPSTSSGKIIAYEYWFDNKYTGKVLANADSVDILKLSKKLATGTLSKGGHIFNIRFKDANNKWSSVISQFITKVPKYGSNNTIVLYEYWFDNNYAGKISQSITANNDYILKSNLTTGILSQGLHSFHIRFKDAGGAWSSTVNQFIVYVLQGVNKINRYEYWFDNKYSQKIVQDITPEVEVYTLNKNISATSLINSSHIFNIRFRQTSGLWSSVLSQTFKKTNTSSFASIIASTNQLLFTDNSPLFVYPNPSKGKFTMGIDNDANIKSVQISDGNGKIIYIKSSLIKTTVLEIDLSNYASGTYYIKASDGKKSYEKKILIGK